MKKSLRGGLVSLAALASTSFADLAFPSSGVWSQPRIYEGSSEITNYNTLMPGSYSFKCTVREIDGVDSSDDLFMNILGPENLNYDWGIINVGAGKDSVRTRTDTITQQGDYVLKFSLGTGETIERNFTVIPEPKNIGLIALGGLGIYLARKKVRA